ncbi:MAG TPA: MopE-related protein, partial [Polyangia bacterium]
CLQSNGGVEICDGVDNNCDGQIDETVNLMSDVANCGGCGVLCGASHAIGRCERGSCTYDCLPGYADMDGLTTNGCEQACTPSNNGVEICDGKDNDCNGKVDDNPTDAGQACGDNGCQPGVLTCIAGARVCVGAVQPSQEVCDGRDNDCNGLVDESDPNLGKLCYPAGAEGCNLQTGVCAGLCQMGAWACTAGALVCKGAVTPQLEICDGKDNNCNGAVDEDFDLQTDPRNCGACGQACNFAQAIAICSAGQCQIGACKEGWVDADHKAGNGCENACTPDGPEVCDGKDNDCNGLTDGADPGLIYPTVNFCRQIGECGKGPGGSTHFSGEATFPTCAVPAGASKPSWICNYPATVQLAGPNQLVAQESWCDGLDNDCDGAIDEFASTTLGTPCSDNAGLGECRRVGTIKCQADKTLAPTCDLSGSLAATPVDEICDGKDNDCDGFIDENWDNPPDLGLPKCAGQECKGVRDAVVHVTATGAPAGGYYIFSYEASHPDATATSSGTASARACSRAGGGVLPWNTVTWVVADSACRAAGMRLCKTTRSATDAVTADEWGFACALGKTCVGGCYPYGDSFDATRCNGAEANRNAPTVSSSQCA